jgi:hypothetical protein
MKKQYFEQEYLSKSDFTILSFLTNMEFFNVKGGAIMSDESYYVQNVQCSKDISIRIKDRITCSDGIIMVVKIEFTASCSDIEHINKNLKGNLELSVVKIRADSHGTANLFSKVEKIESCSLDEIELIEPYNSCRIIKDIVCLESNETFVLDIRLEELTRQSKKNETIIQTLERKIIEESESIGSSFRIIGKINKEKFTKNAEVSFKYDYNKKTTGSKGYTSLVY